MESYITTQSGRITALQGNAVAEFNNARHPLTVDDVIPDGATLLFDNGTEIAIIQQDGSVLTLGNEQSVPDASTDALLSDEIAAIQSLIASGDDPTLSLPETAAGNQTGNTGGFDFVDVERQAEETIANADYSTSAVIKDDSLLVDEDRDEESSVIDDSVSDSDTNTPAGNNNTQPEANNVSVTTEEDTPVSGQLTATDVDGDTLSFATGTEPQNGSVTVNTDGTWTYTPNENYNGGDSFTVVVSDGNGGTDTITVNVGVTSVNDAPVANDDTELSTEEDTPLTIDVLDNDSDVDNDTLTITKATVPAEQGTVAIDDGKLVFTPADNFNGEATISYEISDGQGATDAATATVTVTPVNDAPVLEGENNKPLGDDISVTTSEDKPVSGTLKATDIDGDTVSFEKGTEPQNGSVIVSADGTWTYTPNTDYNGSDSFTVVVSDGNNGTDTISVNVGVTPVNDAPTIDVTAVDSIAEDGVSTATVVASFEVSDTDSENLTTAIENDPNGYFTIDGTDVKLTAAGVAAVNNDELDLKSLTVEVSVTDGVNDP
ncbi:retention module-containing protein, partial [Photobacterium lipolyticum]